MLEEIRDLFMERERERERGCALVELIVCGIVEGGHSVKWTLSSSFSLSPCPPPVAPGNMFSTVRSYIFEWTLLKDEEAKDQTLEPDAILNFVEFSDSIYATDPIIGNSKKR